MTPPLQFVKRSSELIPFKNVSREASRYFASAFFAAWPNGIIRSLCSSRQVIKPTVIFTSESFRLTSSVTRIPVAYKSSSIALSRISFGFAQDGWSRSLVTSSTVRITGTFFSIFGAWIDSAGSLRIIPLLCIQPKNDFADARDLETVDAAFPSFP